MLPYKKLRWENPWHLSVIKVLLDSRNVFTGLCCMPHTLASVQMLAFGCTTSKCISDFLKKNRDPGTQQMLEQNVYELCDSTELTCCTHFRVILPFLNDLQRLTQSLPRFSDCSLFRKISTQTWNMLWSGTSKCKHLDGCKRVRHATQACKYVSTV